MAPLHNRTAPVTNHQVGFDHEAYYLARRYGETHESAMVIGAQEALLQEQQLPSSPESPQSRSVYPPIPLTNMGDTTPACHADSIATPPEEPNPAYQLPDETQFLQRFDTVPMNPYGYEPGPDFVHTIHTTPEADNDSLPFRVPEPRDESQYFQNSVHDTNDSWFDNLFMDTAPVQVPNSLRTQAAPQGYYEEPPTPTSPDINVLDPALFEPVSNTFIPPLILDRETSPPADSLPSLTYPQYDDSKVPDTYAGRRAAIARRDYPFECSVCSRRYLFYNSAQKHYRMSHGVDPKIIERVPDAPRRPPPARPRNQAAVKAREREERKASAVRGTPESEGDASTPDTEPITQATMTAQLSLPPLQQTFTIPPPPPPPTAPTHIDRLLHSIAIGEIPEPLPPWGAMDPEDDTLTWVEALGRWYRRSRFQGEGRLWEFWDGDLQIWRCTVRGGE